MLSKAPFVDLPSAPDSRYHLPPMTLQMYIASIAWLALVLGVLQRRNRKRHVALMLFGIAIDITLVLYLQVTRSAIQTALEFKLDIVQQLHIWLSTAALVLYFPVMFLGFRLLRALNQAQGNQAQGNQGQGNQGQPNSRLRILHIRYAVSAFIFRTAGFLFMFSMWR